MTTDEKVRELARGIAADIRAHGHYQGDNADMPYGIYTLDDGETPAPGPCCLVLSPTWLRLCPETGADLDAIESTLVGAIGLSPPGAWREVLLGWNDNTPTDEVLATLDRIASGQ